MSPRVEGGPISLWQGVARAKSSRPECNTSDLESSDKTRKCTIVLVVTFLPKFVNTALFVTVILEWSEYSPSDPYRV